MSSSMSEIKKETSTPIIKDEMSEDLKQYLAAKAAYARERYNRVKKTPPKKVCTFINYRGEGCTRTTFKDICGFHAAIIRAKSKQ